MYNLFHNSWKVCASKQGVLSAVHPIECAFIAEHWTSSCHGNVSPLYLCDQWSATVHAHSELLRLHAECLKHVLHADAMFLWKYAGLFTVAPRSELGTRSDSLGGQRDD